MLKENYIRQLKRLEIEYVFVCPWKLIINLIFLLTFSIILLDPMVYTQNDWWYYIRVRFSIPLKRYSSKDALSEAIMCMVKNESTSKRSMTHFRHNFMRRRENWEENIPSLKILSICWHWMLLSKKNSLLEANDVGNNAKRNVLEIQDVQYNSKYFCNRQKLGYLNIFIFITLPMSCDLNCNHLS